VDKTDWDNMIR